jgi:DNA-binding GntR family transcriptional regulator
MLVTTVADQILEIIRSEIICGKLRPNEAISERTLVERFQVSRTPVRESLKRLRERGFLTLGRQGVVMVRDVSLPELKDLFYLRVRLEGDAALLAAKNITPKEIAELRDINSRFVKAVSRADVGQMIELRRLFHSITASATRNRWLADILVHLRDNAYQAGPWQWQWHWQDIGQANNTSDMYEHMIDALAVGDGRTYRKLVAKQIRSAFDAYANRLKAEPVARQLSLPVAKRGAKGARSRIDKKRKQG